MRREFDQNMPVYEQLLESARDKKPGRKHCHKARGRAIERERQHQKNSKAEKDRKHRAFKLKVAAFYRGEIETYPEK